MRSCAATAMLLLFALVLSSVALPAQPYTVRSPYLLHPDLSIGYVDSCARFWAKDYDSTGAGGFFTNVDRTGKVITNWGTNKDILCQSRDAYGFTRAFMLTGNEMYLTMARHALDFQYAHGWDKVYGGWYDNISKTGVALDSASDKTAYYQHYALLGPVASYEATRDTGDWGWVMRSYANNDLRFWDSSASSFGYYDAVSRTLSTHSNKSFNATVDAITTHVLSLYQMTGDNAYRTRLLQLAANMRDKLVPTMDPHVIGFVELFDTNWGWVDHAAGDVYNRTIMGHVLKTAWCFGRIQQLLPDSTYLPAAEKLAGNVWQKGYDHVHGGPYKDYDRTNGSMFMYGQDTAKAWWQMEQAVTSGLMLYDLTGKSWYLQMADETLAFFMTYFVDHVYGDVYSDVKSDGSTWLWNDAKGNNGKAAYHSTETGYYVYLYGNLILNHHPATLHYKFASQSIARDIPLNPIDYATAKYAMTAVTLDGGTYTNFDGPSRTLHVPAGTGGHFAVTFGSTVTSVAGSIPAPKTYELSQNYPNPFNPSTTIRFALPARSHVDLSVYNVLGQRVAVLVSGEQEAGRHEVRFAPSGLASGVYFCRLQARGSGAAPGEEHVETRKLVYTR